jgi:hypothetical protein
MSLKNLHGVEYRVTRGGERLGVLMRGDSEVRRSRITCHDEPRIS